MKNKQSLESLVQKGLLEIRSEDQKGSIRDYPIIKIKRDSFKSFVLHLKDSGETKEVKRWMPN